MGQGLYTALGFGALDPDWTGAENENAYDVLEALGVSMSCECNPAWIAVLLAIDEACLRLDWSLVELPLDTPRVHTRTARYLDGTSLDLTAARAIWANAIRAETGIVLPPGRIVLLSDWH